MYDKNLKIEIRPIPNRNKIRDYSEELEFFSQNRILCPLVDPVTLKYVTGLNQKDIKYLQENNFPYDLSDNYVRGVAHQFWESQLVKTELTNSPTFLYPGKSFIDFIKYKYLLASKYIYSSEEEMLGGSKSEATHYIYNEDIENNVKATKLQKKNKLIKDISKLSLAKKREILMILLNENTDNKNEDYITIRFDDILTSSELTSRLEEVLNYSQEKVSLKAMIKDAILKNVLVRSKKGIYFFDVNLGFSEEDVYNFLNENENQEILLSIKEKL